MISCPAGVKIFLYSKVSILALGLFSLLFQGPGCDANHIRVVPRLRIVELYYYYIYRIDNAWVKG